MLDAIRQAQEAYPAFVAAMDEDSRRVIPVIEEALVKYAFQATKGNVKVEHMVLSNIEKQGDVLLGTVNSTLAYTDAVQEGDRVEIEQARIYDWLYVVNGVGVGGFTFRVMWAAFSEKEKAMYSCSRK